MADGWMDGSMDGRVDGWMDGQSQVMNRDEQMVLLKV